MQELEKILEEIDGYVRLYQTPPFGREVEGTVELLKRCGNIIRNHMNDGWIPVGDRLPEENEYFVDTSNDKDFPNGYYKRLEIAYATDTIEYVHGYYDGYKWMGKYLDTIKNVVAWRIHEPYCPERSVEE